MIPYSHQFIDDEDRAAVDAVLRSDWLTQGPKVREFEDALTKYCGAKYAVAVANGTAALQAAYFAAHIGAGDEVIMSPMTFAATANAAVWQGARPVFVDVERETGNIDADLIEVSITPKSKAIVAVDYSGLPCDFDRLRAIAKKHNLILIEDAAHSLGAEYKGKKVGSLADLTTMSFHPVKSITTGEGGAVLTDNEEYYKRLLLFRSHGITKNQTDFINASEGPWYHEMQELGLNYRLTDMQAALGITQLKKLPTFMAARRKIASFYAKELSGIKGLVLPMEFPDRKSSFHLYPIRLAGDLRSRRKEVFEKLQKAGIGVQVHYIPVYQHPYYRKLGYQKELCPVAEDFYSGEISIPIYPSLEEGDQRKVIVALREILKS
ncbi:MAG: UDP-4-amino-4,6-dideoxy-N-acetyl-beta-L-altrosamine transaminase [Patescibacteria group bacterium]|nr:UDP-4-amino-4,6-dideoxy-N-acetyl-beta-L-altrosamine transaminase [Patescibacteria group bacterium]